MPKIIFFFLISVLIQTTVPCIGKPENPLGKADSLFAGQRFSDSKDLYLKAFFERKITTPSSLLKLAFIEESIDDYVMSIYFLHQYYLFRPGKKVKTKIEEMATQKKLSGYSIDEADYAYYLYRAYSSYIQAGFLILASILFLFLLNRKRKGLSLGYSPVFTIFFLLVSAYLYNYQLPYKRAILLADKAFLMSGPAAGSSVVDVLSKGHRLDWVGENDIWFEVKWNEKKGWLKKSELLFFL